MRCKSCNTMKASTDFYVSNRTRCKDCIKESVQANRLQKIEYYRAFDKARASLPHRVAARKAYQQTTAFAESHEAAVKRWAAKHPERKNASTVMRNAIRDGKLVPWPVCAVPACTNRPQGHHPDYSRPLDVVWLCDTHHKEAHALVRKAA